MEIVLSKAQFFGELATCTPALAHQSLSLQHIIVSEGRLVGIVGWSRCDYVPEVVERLRYSFALPQFEGETEWYQLLSQAWYFHRPPPPLYTLACALYFHHTRRNSVPPEYRPFLDPHMRRLSDKLLRKHGVHAYGARHDHRRPRNREGSDHDVQGVVPFHRSHSTPAQSVSSALPATPTHGSSHRHDATRARRHTGPADPSEVRADAVSVILRLLHCDTAGLDERMIF